MVLPGAVEFDRCKNVIFPDPPNPFKTPSTFPNSIFCPMWASLFRPVRLNRNLFFGWLLCLVLIHGQTTGCSWTPEVETVLFQGPGGRIALQTSSDFLQIPQHPTDLSESTIQEILQGLTTTKEHGILQDFLFSSSSPRPVFSSSQITFLAPQLSKSLLQATSEELIAFQIDATEEGQLPIGGTAALFSPNIFFLVLEQMEKTTPRSPKTGSTAETRLQYTSLAHSRKEAMLPQDQSSTFLNVSSRKAWIAINLDALLSPSAPASTSNPSHASPPPMRQDGPPSPDTQNLQEQINQLQKQVEEQSKKIRQLQQENP